MLIIFGILGLLQSTVLPALLLMKLCRLRGGITERLLWMLPLSLIPNYLLIFLLAALHLYTRPVMLCFLAVEILALLVLYRETLTRPAGETVTLAGGTPSAE